MSTEASKSAAPFAVGQAVRHVDGTLGTVTAIQPFGIVEWKSCGKYRMSGEAALKDASGESYRWRAATGSAQ